MLYPACGVILGNLITSKITEKKYPTAAYALTLALTGILVVISLISVIFPREPLTLPGTEGYTVYNLAAQILLIPFSILIYILFFTTDKTRKDNAGTLRKNPVTSVLMVALFLVIYFLRVFMSVGLSELIDHNGAEELNQIIGNLTDKKNIAVMIFLIPSYFLSFIIFFGEEYGWRYFLQPRMQQKFGMKKGVILLGIIWGLWHLPMDFMYYTTTTGLQMQVNQIIVCIAYAIFFGFTYMKTQNIWVPVIIHFLNNNLIPVLQNNQNADALQNQEVSWSDIPLAALLMIFYIIFIFAKEYRSPKKKTE
jgi:membrane protease YdiL (CAAX protease family)